MTLTDEDRALTYEEAERLALLAIHDVDGRGMVGRGRNHLHQRVARALLSAARDEGRAEGLGGEWVMVPREPTSEMLKAAGDYADECAIQNYGGAPDAEGVWDAMLAAAPPASQTQPRETPADPDHMNLRGTCEDPRLKQAGYIVCGSNADREWHWKPPGGAWRDGHRSEEAAVNAALKHLAASQTQEG